MKKWVQPLGQRGRAGAADAGSEVARYQARLLRVYAPGAAAKKRAAAPEG